MSNSCQCCKYCCCVSCVYLVIMAANDSNAEADVSQVKDKFRVTVASSDQPQPSHFTPKRESPAMPPQRQQKRRWDTNYFVCQRITATAIVNGVKEVQSKIMKMAPEFSSCFADPASLHMTFCSLALDNDSQVTLASTVSLLMLFWPVAVLGKNIWGAWPRIIWEATTAKRNYYRTN